MLTGWKDFDDTLRTLDRLQRRAGLVFDAFEPFGRRERVPQRIRAAWPATNVFETKEAFVVHLRERAPVAFTRKLPRPARVDADAVSATLAHGVLTVTLPKAREALPRQVAVKVG